MTDTHSGRSKVYSDVNGAAAAPIQDSEAFACIAGDTAPAKAAGASRTPRQPSAASAASAAPAVVAIPTGCSATATSLCIAGRFAIEVQYRTAQGGSAAGSERP